MKNLLIRKELSKKEIDFMDFTSFIVNTAVENDEDMGFLSEKDYHNGDFENSLYSSSESEAWNNLEKLIGRDYDQMEKEFKSCRWEDNENTAIISFENDQKEYAILRM